MAEILGDGSDRGGNVELGDLGNRGIRLSCSVGVGGCWVAWASDAWTSVAWASVAWASIAWASVAWTSVAWASVAWTSVAWASVAWASVAWASVAWASVDWWLDGGLVVRRWLSDFKGRSGRVRQECVCVCV